ncbi:hypothetical protein LU290_08095 [Moraxella nasibovis]|uniref:MCR_0457 family protein n=1 Tax=Moraxella nasibovis TaxID=2904120 RepID=UPI0024109962|nr:hypothetical protein [Moraxella nasibovis]WFF38210.1 hypothetical protein LU290_08095 [Moraxella nasibovis]
MIVTIKRSPKRSSNSQKHPNLTAFLSSHRTLLAALLVLACLTNISHANPRFVNMQGKFHKTSSAELTVSQYELALVQVLSEICPPMLSNQQRIQFAHAYQQQLRSFMPTSTNPNNTLRQLRTQLGYRSALQNIRAWTATYPPAQNRKICLQFTEVEF